MRLKRGLMILQDLQKWQNKLEAGIELAQRFYTDYRNKLPETCRKIAFFGMGGSGIAGRMIKSIFTLHGGARVDIYNVAEVCSLVSEKTLVFVITYSGNTWETVVALQDLVAKKIPTVVITHGGRALQIAQEYNLPYVLIPDAVSPRSALGYFLGLGRKGSLPDRNLHLSQ